MPESNIHSPIPFIRVSVSEAAKLFGLSDKTVRTAIKNKDIKYIVINGRYKINFESLLAWTQLSLRRQNKLQRHGIGKYVKQWDMPANS